MGKALSVVVEREKAKETLPTPPVAVLMIGLLGPETEATTASTELHSDPAPPFVLK